MTPKQPEPRGGKPRTGGSKPRWTKDDTRRTERVRSAAERPRAARPKPWEADRPADARPHRQRGERPDWTPRGYKADGTDRRRAGGRDAGQDAGRSARYGADGGRSARYGADGGRGGERSGGRDAWRGTDHGARPTRESRQNARNEAHSDRNGLDSRRPQQFGTRPEREDRPWREERPWQRDRQPRPSESAPYGRRDAGADRAPQAFTPVEDVVHERLDAQAVAADAGEGLGFADLGLGQNIVKQLAALGAEQPFPIQAATIPEVLAGRDVLGRGRTGSGKTIAFAAPLVEGLLRQQADKPRRTMGRAPRALILAPTRELAQQIDRTVQPLARSVGVFTISIVGGVPYERQLTGLRRGVDIVIGTPGRIQDLISKGELDLSGITVTVLDEADHMCDLGFLEPVQEILRLTPAGSQRLLFSATLDAAVESLVAEFLDEPSVHEVEGEDQASSTITHKVWIVDASAKRDFVKELAGSVGRSIVFARTRAFAEELSELLGYAGIPAASLHGDLNQSKRNRSLQALTRGDVRSLVATDVAARGIHVDDIDLVIQADMPDDHKTYLHRSGRTGRAGALGTVITVIPPGRRRRMEELLRNAGIEAEWEDKATTRRPDRDRPFRQDRPFGERGTGRPQSEPGTARSLSERSETKGARPPRQDRMFPDDWAEFQAWKAARDAAAQPAETDGTPSA